VAGDDQLIVEHGYVPDPGVDAGAKRLPRGPVPAHDVADGGAVNVVELPGHDEFISVDGQAGDGAAGTERAGGRPGVTVPSHQIVRCQPVGRTGGSTCEDLSVVDADIAHEEWDTCSQAVPFLAIPSGDVLGEHAAGPVESPTSDGAFRKRTGAVG